MLWINRAAGGFGGRDVLRCVHTVKRIEPCNHNLSGTASLPNFGRFAVLERWGEFQSGKLTYSHPANAPRDFQRFACLFRPPGAAGFGSPDPFFAMRLLLMVFENSYRIPCAIFPRGTAPGPSRPRVPTRMRFCVPAPWFCETKSLHAPPREERMARLFARNAHDGRGTGKSHAVRGRMFPCAAAKML